jgi:hypothetical protein
MPRRRPAPVRARQPHGRPIRQVSRVSAPALRAIADFERTYSDPGDVAEALDDWARFVRGPARAITRYATELNPCPCCDSLDPAVARALLRTALIALPTRAARELRALVRPLDDLYLARSIPNPEHAHLRDLLE